MELVMVRHLSIEGRAPGGGHDAKQEWARVGTR
jgi:hypothetical protein